MSRRIALLVALLGAPCEPAVASEPPRPNLLVVFVDDLAAIMDDDPIPEVRIQG